MRFSKRFSICLVIAAVCCAVAHADTLTLDPMSGNYTFSYQVEGGISTTTYTPAATQIDPPSLTSSISIINATQIRYEYTLANGSTAKAGLRQFAFRGIPNLLVGELADLPNQTRAQDIALFASYHQAMTTPLSWESDLYRHDTYPSKGYSHIGWSAETEQLVNGVQVVIPRANRGVLPGGTQSDFGFTSLDLPGINQARLQGPMGIIAYADEGPEDPQDGTLNALQTLQENDFASRNAAAPMIAVPTPYDAAVTLENIQTHVHTWIAKQLLDTAFSAQLDPLFQAAIDAYRLNQREVGKKKLETLREFIKQQQPDAEKQAAGVNPIAVPPAKIDLLAARILFFDVGYVMERGSQ